MEVRPRPSPGSAPFAWDDTSTIMESAGRQRYGMDQKASVEGTTRGDLSVQAVLPCASTGNFLEVVGRCSGCGKADHGAQACPRAEEK